MIENPSINLLAKRITQLDGLAHVQMNHSLLSSSNKCTSCETCGQASWLEAQYEGDGGHHEIAFFATVHFYVAVTATTAVAVCVGIDGREINVAQTEDGT